MEQNEKKLLLTDALDGALRVDSLDVPGGVVPDEDAVDAVLAALAAALEKFYLYIRERHKKRRELFFLIFLSFSCSSRNKTQKKKKTHPARRVVERLPVKVPQVVAHRVGRGGIEQRPRVARPVVPPAHAEERRRGGLLGRDGLVLAVLGRAAADAVLVPVELLACF